MNSSNSQNPSKMKRTEVKTEKDRLRGIVLLTCLQPNCNTSFKVRWANVKDKEHFICPKCKKKIAIIGTEFKPPKLK